MQSLNVIDFFNNLTPTIHPFIDQNFSVFFMHNAARILVNLIAYLYVLIKFFKVLCYSKMTFEWLPLVNPYVWPFSMFQIATKPYFSFWAKLLPTVKFQKSSLEVSGIIALEALNSCTFFLVKSTNLLVSFLEKTENLLQQ